MTDLKTKPTEIKVSDYLATIIDEARLSDAKQLIALIQNITKQSPVMWGTNIIGFGSYSYKYASGREGKTMKIGFSARKEHSVLYGVIFYDYNIRLLDELGKYKQGKGCLYIKSLADIKLKILEQMIKNAYAQAAPNEI